jgi:lipoprotein-anchoring transpeptidase ErfK/SrfK
MKQISRRDFLKLGGLALAGLAFSPFLPEFSGYEDADLVRVAKDPVSVYKEPSDKSRIVNTWPRDSLIHVYDMVEVETPGANPLWYRVYGGYMNASRLQKVRVHYNNPLSSLPAAKVISEITVPYSQAYRYDQWKGWYPTYRLYYTSIQWITGIESGPDGKAWYVIQDEADKNIRYYVPAVQLRPISPDEVAPLAPEVPMESKRIDVNLSTQTLTCLEYEQAAFSARVSSGVSGLFDTPAGHFNVQVKLPSRNMSTTVPPAEDIPLVGVPWTTFFTSEGHAFHGTYWHNNFGVPMSHGCVNMRNEDALRLFRWTSPTAGFEDIDQQTLDVRGFGTSVDIHY